MLVDGAAIKGPEYVYQDVCRRNKELFTMRCSNGKETEGFWECTRVGGGLECFLFVNRGLYERWFR